MNKLVVCCGTTCYLTAGDRIDKLEQMIKANFKDDIEVVPSACLGQCMKNKNQPPFVKFNDEIISEATNENIIKELKKRLNR